MIHWDMSRVRELMLGAGEMALQYFDRPETRLKADNSLVTQADNAIEDFFRSKLTGDGALLLGEESAEGWTQAEVDAALAGSTWIVDPIDGTAPYANQLPTWGISLGFMEAGVLTHGAIFLPRTGELFITEGARVHYHRGARNPAYWSFEELSELAVQDHPYVPTGMISLPREVVYGGHFSGPNPVQANGSAVYSIAKLLRGAYLCYIARIKLWDLAGSLPILDRLGFSVVRRDGITMDLRVNPDNWVLDADSRRLWKAHDLLFIARDRRTIEVMQDQYQSRIDTEEP